MISSRLQESLVEALAYCHCRELPDEALPDKIWVRALALVVRNNGDNSYVYVEKIPNLKYRIVRDFGFGGSIFKILKFYPLSYLDEDLMPKFDKERKQPRIEFLQKMGCTQDNLEDCTIKELNNLILGVVIQRQLKEEKKYM
jgi:hypothetical protein